MCVCGVQCVGLNIWISLIPIPLTLIIDRLLNLGGSGPCPCPLLIHNRCWAKPFLFSCLLNKHQEWWHNHHFESHTDIHTELILSGISVILFFFFFPPERISWILQWSTVWYNSVRTAVACCGSGWARVYGYKLRMIKGVITERHGFAISHFFFVKSSLLNWFKLSIKQTLSSL